LNQKLQKERGMYDLMVQQAAEEREKEKAHQKQPMLEHMSQQPGLVDHQGADSDRTANITFVTLEDGLLGRGSFGEVYKVAESSMGAEFARKCIHIDLCASAGRREDDVIKEVRIMQKLRHRHITTVLFHAKKGNKFSIFMTPVADFDLKAFLINCTKDDFPASMTKQIDKWYGCLMDALAYAHNCSIKHQDIKPENILIKGNAPYLSDFGLARDFSSLEDSTSRGDKGHGNLMYRAPEVKPDGKHGRAADVFSMGCVFSEMFTVSQGKSLQQYENMRGEKVYKWCLASVKEWMNSPQFESGRLNDLIKDEIVDMIKESSDVRPTASDVLHHLKREAAFFCVETH
jgi:serine/threonine protein kinase